MAKAIIEGELTMRDQQFNETLNKAEKRAATFGERFKNAIGVEGLKSERIVSRNLGRIAQSFTSGAGAADIFAESSTAALESLKGGLALGAGVAVGYALYEGLSKAQEEALKLDESLEKIHRTSNESGAFAGTDEIQSNLKGISDEMDKLRERNNREGSGIFGSLTKFSRKALGSVLGEGSFSEQDKKDAEQFLGLRKDASAEVDKLAEKQHDLNEANAQSVSGSEEVSDSLKEQITHRERIGVLARLESSLGIDNSAARDEENQRDQQANAAIKEKYNLRQEEQSILDKSLNLQESGLTKDQQSLEILRAKIALLDKRIAGPLSSEERAKLGSDQRDLVNQQDRLLYTEKNKTPEQRADEQLEAQRYNQFVRGLTPSNPNAYITSPDAYARSPDAYNDSREPGFNANGRDYQTPSFPSHLDVFKKRPGQNNDVGEDSGKGNSLSGLTSSVTNLVTALQQIAGKVQVA